MADDWVLVGNLAVMGVAASNLVLLVLLTVTKRDRVTWASFQETARDPSMMALQYIMGVIFFCWVIIIFIVH
jgi:hypothetical protein